jgi:DNA mismatch repair protein MutL
MGMIRQLDDKLANMIAAGEVVENMASVVKELLENALDAGATDISILLEDYGLKTIKIIDNGCGMDRDDLHMAFKRHATSKIKTHHDLFHIASLGFRGEALPSIASVSTLTIESSTDGVKGHLVTMKQGEITEDRVSVARKGTAITVSQIFYNTPARLKHLKSETRELAFIVDYVNKIALAHPSTRIHLMHENKTLLQTNGDGDLLKIIYQIYDLDIAKNMLSFENQNGYFKIKGLTAKSHIYRSSKQHITLIANKRLIKNQKVSSSIVEAYKSYLPIGKYPITYLEITVDPLLIDVNIHPQKLEIKFSEEMALVELIKTTIHKRLKAENLIPRVQEKTYSNEKIYEQDALNFTYEEPLNQDLTIDEAPISVEEAFPKSEPLKKLPDMEYIGQAFGTYLLFQNYDGFYMLDQHAAAERIRYERYLDHMAKETSSTKPLLVPFKVPLSSDEVIAFNTYKEALSQFGIKASISKDNTLEISDIPYWFLEGHETDYTEIVIEAILSETVVKKEDIVNKLAIDLACKHSIKANQYIRKEEVSAIIKDLNQTRNPYHCPHGRPTLIHFTKEALEKLFNRIQS